jgi:nondiscriminating glutamyl-tRNA synthetase
MSIRVRYAPSPTGELHLGSLRTVIFNYLIAKQAGGTFIMRIEDTDQARLVEGSAERQLEAMRWMGIEPDEGVCIDDRGIRIERGELGPYTQSNRLSIYKEYSEKLLKSGKAYRCFCTSERLEAMREEQQKNKQAPRYDRHCRALSAEESESRAAAGEPFVVRHALPDNEEVIFTDVVRGELSFNSKDLDDYVLMKSDGFPTYQLANVVDDHLMEITHVLRGEEWIPSAPKNLLLYKDLGWTPPLFAQLPVILGPDGKRKLSKRDGDVAVMDYKPKGYLPEALFNVLTFLGWSPGTEQEFFTMDELVQAFKLERVQKSPAVFSFDRLDYVNGWYIRQMKIENVVSHMLPYLLDSGLLTEDGNSYSIVQEIEHTHASTEHYVRGVAHAVQERMKHFDETVELTRFFFERPEISPEMLELIVPKKATLEDTIEKLKETIKVLEGIGKSWDEQELHDKVIDFIAKSGWKNGEVLWPIRAGLTGASASPGAFEMLSLLGKKESIIRLTGIIEAVS